MDFHNVLCDVGAQMISKANDKSRQWVQAESVENGAKKVAETMTRYIPIEIHGLTSDITMLFPTHTIQLVD